MCPHAMKSKKTLIGKLLHQNKCGQRETAEILHVSQRAVANVDKKPKEKLRLSSRKIGNGKGVL